MSCSIVTLSSKVAAYAVTSVHNRTTRARRAARGASPCGADNDVSGDSECRSGIRMKCRALVDTVVPRHCRDPLPWIRGAAAARHPLQRYLHALPLARMLTSRRASPPASPFITLTKVTSLLVSYSHSPI